jgi:hypothetical protein
MPKGLQDHPSIANIWDLGRIVACRSTEDAMFSAFGIGSPSLGPDDVAMMQSLVREHCQKKAIEPESEDGRYVARELLKWFQVGLTDQNRLLELLGSRD